MKRREFITLLGGAAVTWPLGAGAQQPAMLVIGFLRDTSLAHVTYLVVAFRRGLKEAGFIEGQNVVIEYRSAEDQADRLPALVADLVHRQVALIVCNTASALAAKAATSTVPIVFVTGGDPVRDGLVASLNRPGGNVTGVSFLNSVLAAKRLELLRQIAPKATIIAAMSENSSSPDIEAERRDLLAAAQAIGQQLIVLDVSSDRSICGRHFIVAEPPRDGIHPRRMTSRCTRDVRTRPRESMLDRPIVPVPDVSGVAAPAVVRDVIAAKTTTFTHR